MFEQFRHVVIHEIAHAYHDLVVKDGFDNQCVIDTYEKSVTQRRLHTGIGQYAGTNHMEYFAELVSVGFRATRVFHHPPPNKVLDQGYEWLLGPFAGSSDWEYSQKTANAPALARYDLPGARMFEKLVVATGWAESWGGHQHPGTYPVGKPGYLPAEAVELLGTVDCDCGLEEQPACKLRDVQPPQGATPKAQPLRP